MEENHNYYDKQNNICQYNNYINSIICNNLSGLKMDSNINKLFNCKNKEESKNKDFLNENNYQQNMLFNKEYKHKNNNKSMNDNEFYQKYIFNNQKAEDRIPINYSKKNGCLFNSINYNNINQNYNGINNKYSIIYENQVQRNNGQNDYQNTNFNLQNIKSNTSQNQIYLLKNFHEPPLIALKCTGNTTYINTVLQCLANISNVTNHFLKNMSFINKHKEQIPICYAFFKVVSNLFPNPFQPKQYINKYDPKEFYDYILANNFVFKGKSTKNVIDFLVYLINKIHDEDLLNPIYNNQKQLEELNNDNIGKYCQYLQTHENSVILKNFSYISQNAKTCWNCNQQIINFQKFFTYDLNLDLSLNKIAFEHKEELSIYDCIKFTSQEEYIFNIYCDKCKTKNNFYKKFSIHVSQSILIFLLRGMEKKEIIENMKNDNIKIKVDIDLDLSNFIALKDEEFSKYTFHGMILYDSENKEYLAYSISPINKKLYKYIKEQIIQVEQNDFINLFDYKLYPVILFYRHFTN